MPWCICAEQTTIRPGWIQQSVGNCDTVTQIYIHFNFQTLYMLNECTNEMATIVYSITLCHTEVEPIYNPFILAFDSEFINVMCFELSNVCMTIATFPYLSRCIRISSMYVHTRTIPHSLFEAVGFCFSWNFFALAIYDNANGQCAS